MKWIAVFSTIVAGHPATVDDIDGPNEFRSVRACMGHAIVATPKLERILGDYLGHDVKITWRCSYMGIVR